MFTAGVLGMAFYVGVSMNNPLVGFGILAGGGVAGAFWAKEQDQQDRGAHLFLPPDRSQRPRFSDFTEATPTPPRRSQI